MAASSQTNFKDPAMDKLLQDVSEETLLVALKMAQLFEGKGDIQSMLKGFTNSPSDQTNTNTNSSQQSHTESGNSRNDFQEMPGNGTSDLESTGNNGNGLAEVKVNGSLGDGDEKMEEWDTGTSTEVQSERDASILSSSPDKLEESSDQFFSCDDQQTMSDAIESNKNYLDGSEHWKNDGTIYVQQPSENKDEVQQKPPTHQEEVDIDNMEDSKNELRPNNRMESSSGTQSPGSEMSESPPESKFHLTRPFSTPKGLTEAIEDLGNSPSVTIQPESHQANYKAPSLPDVNLDSSTTLTEPESQKSFLNKGTSISGLPKASGLSDHKPGLSGTHLEGQDEKLPSLIPSGQKEPALLSSQRSKSSQEDESALSGAHLAERDEMLPPSPSGQKEPALLSSQGTQSFQEGALGGTSSSLKPHENRRPEERSTVTSSVTPLRNKSTLDSVPEITTSPLSFMSPLPSIPLYYQPHVVIQNNLPVLMLRPVLASNISHDMKETVLLGATPMMLPLMGGQLGDFRIRMDSDNASSDAESGHLVDKSDREACGTQLTPTEAYSTESHMEGRAQKKMHGKHEEQDTRPISSGNACMSGFEEKSCTMQPRNPFFSSSATATTYTLPTSTTPDYNFGHPVTTSTVPSMSSNPFHPENPRTYTDDCFGRTDFKTIPKSMLASQLPPRGPPVGQIRGPSMTPMGSQSPMKIPVVQTSARARMPWELPVSQPHDNTTPPRGPPGSQISNHATPPTGPSRSPIGISSQSSMGLPVSEVGASATIPWGLPVSHHGNTTPPRGPPVSYVSGSTTLPTGHLVGQAIGNNMAPKQTIPSDSLLTFVSKEQNTDIQAKESEIDYNPVPVSMDSTATSPRGNFSVVTSSVAPSNSGVTNEGLAKGGTGTTDLRNTQVDLQPEQAPNPRVKILMPGHVAPHWVPDDEVFKCAYCHLKFTFIRRKHHCRGCGKIFCSDCCCQLARLSYLQYQIGRICIICTNSIKEEIRKRKKNERSQKSSRRRASSAHVRKGNPTASSPAKTVTSESQPTLSSSAVRSMKSGPQLISSSSQQPSPNMSTPTLNSSLSTNPETLSHPLAQLVYVHTDLIPAQTNHTPPIQPSSGTFNGQPGYSNGWQANASFPQNNPAQTTYQESYISSTAQPVGLPVTLATPQDMPPISQSDQSAFYTPQSQAAHQNFSSQQEQARPSPDSRQKSTDSSEMKIPLRPAGRVVSWRGENFTSRLLAQDRRKALARDLRDLPHGVTMQIAEDLQVIIKKIKVQKNPAIPAWCCFSNGLKSFNQQEIVMIFQVRPKEDVMPEEMLRMYKVILDLVKLGNIFQHSNYLAFNSPFLGTSDNAAFIFTKYNLTPKMKAIGEERQSFLYAVLVKRSELEYAKYTPMRFLVRLGQETKSFPFPVINSRDRAAVYDGVDGDDIIYNTTLALNNYLKNSIPEALIPGLIVLQEDSKVVLQLPCEAQPTIMNFFDRLILKTNQTSTIPIVSDISTNVDQFRVYHQSIHTEQVSLPKHVSLFRNPNNPTHCGIHLVTGLGFVILHLGASDTPTLQQRGELLDDGVIIHLTNIHTNKLRQSLVDRSNCNFYLGDRHQILYFELRWIQEPQDTPNTDNLTQPYPTSQPGSYPGSATIDVRHSGNPSQLKKLANARVGGVLILIRLFEERIKQACMESLMMHANKMKTDETKEIVLRLSMRDGYKQWSIGPSNQPMGLIRSLQMALHSVKLPDLQKACLELSFDVTIIKQ